MVKLISIHSVHMAIMVYQASVRPQFDLKVTVEHTKMEGPPKTELALVPSTNFDTCMSSRYMYIKDWTIPAACHSKISETYQTIIQHWSTPKDNIGLNAITRCRLHKLVFETITQCDKQFYFHRVLYNYRKEIETGNKTSIQSTVARLVQYLYKNWPVLASYAVSTVFRDTKFRLLGMLKGIVVKVARDHLILSPNPAFQYVKQNCLWRSKRERKFWIMLKDELTTYRLVMKATRPTSEGLPNTWMDLERDFQLIIHYSAEQRTLF